MKILAKLALRNMGWTCQEPGWWTHEAHGLCQEIDGKWWIYPVACDRLGPFKTALKAAESLRQQ